METTRQALMNDTSVVRMLYMALELSGNKWKVAIGDGQRAPSQRSIAAGDTNELLQVVEKAKKRCRLHGVVRVLSCYEAGRDGFWLHRWLLEQGIENVVVDSSSIEVNRRARRAQRAAGRRAQNAPGAGALEARAQRAHQSHALLAGAAQRAPGQSRWARLERAFAAAQGAVARGVVGRNRARERTRAAGVPADAHAGEEPTGTSQAHERGAAGGFAQAARHWLDQRLAAHTRAVWLAWLWQPPTAGRLRG